MPSDRTPFPKPGTHVWSDSSDVHVPVGGATRPPKNRRLLVRRIVWLAPVWTLGAYASRSIRSYYGHRAIPGPEHWVAIVSLAVGAGVAGALMFIAMRRSSVFLMALLGAAVWAMAFVSAIPATKAVCGGDVVAGCEHVQAIQWPFVAVSAYLPILAGLFGASTLLWRFVPSRANARSA